MLDVYRCSVVRRERTCRMLSKPALALREATSVLIMSSGRGEPSTTRYATQLSHTSSVMHN